MTTREKAEAVLAAAYRGLHHVHPGSLKDMLCGVEVNVYDDISTYDYDVLTRLVFAAHDHGMRLTIRASGPHLLKLWLHERTRTGGIADRHPSLDEAIAEYRKNHEVPK